MDDLQAFKELYKMKAVRQLVKGLFDVELSDMQCEIVRLVAYDEYKRTIICCMTRYGKSYAVSLGLCLWIMFNKDKRLIIVAPTFEKTSIIRNYMANWISMCPLLINLLDLDRFGFNRIKREVSRSRMTWKNGIEMRTLSATGKGDALMGFGADKIVVDEECDIDYEVHRSKITRMLGDNKDSTYIGIGNPWHRDNQMWQHWIDPEWHKVHIGWEVALKENRISQEFVNEQRKQITEREFQVLYEANFPEEAEDQLIKYSWLVNAMRTHIPIGQKIMGWDIARMGNDFTVGTYGYKNNESYSVEGIQESSQEDTMKTVGRILYLNNKFKADTIIIDTNGLGAGVTDRINELKTEGKVSSEIVGFMSGESPTTEENKERFMNKKAEAYFKMRKLFEDGKIIIPKHPKLVNELLHMKWTLTSNGKIKILDPGEGKDDTAVAKSPDFADSLCYFCWEAERRGLSFGGLNLK